MPNQISIHVRNTFLSISGGVSFGKSGTGHPSLQFQYMPKPILAAEEYRARAEACLEHAARTTDFEQRQSLLNLAKTYRCLADIADRREDAAIGE